MCVIVITILSQAFRTMEQVIIKETLDEQLESIKMIGKTIFSYKKITEDLVTEVIVSSKYADKLKNGQIEIYQTFSFYNDIELAIKFGTICILTINKREYNIICNSNNILQNIEKRLPQLAIYLSKLYLDAKVKFSEDKNNIIKIFEEARKYFRQLPESSWCYLVSYLGCDLKIIPKTAFGCTLILQQYGSEKTLKCFFDFDSGLITILQKPCSCCLKPLLHYNLIFNSTNKLCSIDETEIKCLECFICEKLALIDVNQTDIDNELLYYKAIIGDDTAVDIQRIIICRVLQSKFNIVISKLRLIISRQIRDAGINIEQRPIEDRLLSKHKNILMPFELHIIVATPDNIKEQVNVHAIMDDNNIATAVWTTVSLE